jgi:hypothetical protein
MASLGHNETHELVLYFLDNHAPQPVIIGRLILLALEWGRM